MNKKHKKMGFFKKIALAISDFRFYPLMLKTNSTLAVIGHFIVFMMILTTVMTIGFYNRAFTSIDEIIDRYDDAIPEFSFKDGVLEVETQEVYKVANDFVVLIDTEYNYENATNLEDYQKYDVYDNRIFINSDAITFEANDESSGTEQTQVAEQILLTQVSGDFNKEILKQYILEARESNYAKVIIFVSLGISIFLGYFFYKLLEVVLYVIMTSLLATLYGIKLNYKNYIKIVLYAITLPYILETISIVYLGSINDATFIVSNILAYIYLIYAVRAVKLDAFILIMSNSNNIKKSKENDTKEDNQVQILDGNLDDTSKDKEDDDTQK